MPTNPITPVDAEIEAELAKQKKIQRDREGGNEAEQNRGGSGETAADSDEGQRQPS